ncbi:MAG: OB-fold nucleic acid binding domain-containing protein [Nanoarchaeota archaeon]|nr:OB-fold nucleic acid binding domain-containing protein [Nanoarchaeota archaeon]
MEKSQKRQVAYEVKINEIIKGSYVKEEGEWSPNYIEIGNKKISRVNLMAAIVDKQNQENTKYQNLIIDDGSGRISIRSFEENNNFDSVGIGDIVLIIGRPREYLNEKYIVSEILRKIDNPKWVELRKLKLGSVEQPKEEETSVEVNEEEVKEEPIEDDTDAKILSLIKECDNGEGADTQDIIKKSNVEEAEEIVTKLLEQGEVFEIKPGKLKILE